MPLVLSPRGDLRAVAGAAVAVALMLLPGEAAAQRSFDFSAGAFWGGHAPGGPVAPAWIQSSRFLDQWVLEGASRVDTVFEDRGWNVDGDVRVTREDRYETLMVGLRSPTAEGWVGFYYQLLAGGFRTARAMKYESDTVDIEAENARCGAFGGDGGFVAPCDPPFPAGKTAYGFALQPGVGVEFWGPDFDVPFISLVELGLRVAADLPILADRDHVEVRPRLAVMLVVGFGP